jgi:hypothetical protein
MQVTISCIGLWHTWQVVTATHSVYRVYDALSHISAPSQRRAVRVSALSHQASLSA